MRRGAPARPLLILACSATKITEPAVAYQLYDGPAFRTLRASGWGTPAGPNCRLQILSAQHGVLSAYALVAPYERRMDEERAEELAALDADEVADKLFLRVRGHRNPSLDLVHFPASEVFVWGGQLYRSVVEAWAEAGAFADVPGGVEYSHGGIGEQLGQLKRWLEARKVGA